MNPTVPARLRVLAAVATAPGYSSQMRICSLADVSVKSIKNAERNGHLMRSDLLGYSVTSEGWGLLRHG